MPCYGVRHCGEKTRGKGGKYLPEKRGFGTAGRTFMKISRFFSVKKRKRKKKCAVRRILLYIL